MPGEGNGYPLQYSCLRNPRAEGPGRLQSTGSQRVAHDWWCIYRHTQTHSLAQKMRNYNLYHSMAAVLMGVLPHPTQTPTSILVYLLTQTSKHSPKKLCFNNIFWQLQNIRIVNKYQQHIWRLLSILLKILIPSNASRNRNLSSSPWSLTVKLTLLLFKKKVYWDINHTEDSLV